MVDESIDDALVGALFTLVVFPGDDNLAALLAAFEIELQIGIFGNSIPDIAVLLEVMAGADEYDSTVSQKKVPEYSSHLSTDNKFRFAYFEEALNHPGIDPEISAAIKNKIEQLQNDGHEVRAVPFELHDYIVPAYYVLTTAEASSNLSRYDGVRYGHRAEKVQDLQELYSKSRTEGFGKEVKKRIMLGTFVLSVGYYDAYYTKAQQVRQLIKDKKNEIFNHYDFILMPTTPNFSPTLGTSEKDPISTYLADIYTVFANLAGVPAISIPISTKKHALPIGVQLIADDFQEYKLLNFAKKLESELI